VRPNRQASPAARLDEALTAALDSYFEHLGNQTPHAVYEMVTLAMERTLIPYALERCEGNLSQTALLLGITRNTLRKKIQIHNIPINPSFKTKTYGCP
jgi:Fis family transcriptional regulator, factor for inversion stimulation protein